MTNGNLSSEAHAVAANIEATLAMTALEITLLVLCEHGVFEPECLGEIVGRTDGFVRSVKVDTPEEEEALRHVMQRVEIMASRLSVNLRRN